MNYTADKLGHLLYSILYKCVPKLKPRRKITISNNIYHIVVARYSENISWLRSEVKNCIIYNKGNKLNLSNEIMLKNVGRESHTYLHYIINYYENLPEVVVFTQGCISDHRNLTLKDLMNMKDEALERGKSIPCLKYNYTSEDKGSFENKKPWTPVWNKGKNKFYLEKNYKNKKPILFIDWFISNISDNYPNPIEVYRAGIFAVKKELILKNSKSYYQNLIEELIHSRNPAEGHFFERSWYYIFE